MLHCIHVMTLIGCVSVIYRLFSLLARSNIATCMQFRVRYFHSLVPSPPPSIFVHMHKLGMRLHGLLSVAMQFD